MEALTAWSSVYPTTPTNLNVTVRGSAVKKVYLKPEDTVPEVVNMNGNKVSVYVEGAYSYTTKDIQKNNYFCYRNY